MTLTTPITRYRNVPGDVLFLAVPSIKLFAFIPFFLCKSMRVLVIEDEPELLSILAKGLREDGYAVDEAPDGEHGLYKAVTWDYDAIVLDLMLPKIDGWG